MQLEDGLDKLTFMLIILAEETQAVHNGGSNNDLFCMPRLLLLSGLEQVADRNRTVEYIIFSKSSIYICMTCNSCMARIMYTN